MADELKKAVDHRDRFLVSLGKATNPTAGTAKPSIVKKKSSDLQDRWDAYETQFLATEHEDDDAEKAAEEEFIERYDRYSAAQGSASDLLESTGPEADSV